MAAFTLNIQTDNAAFDPADRGTEVARILRELADKVEGMPLDVGDSFTLHDVNGNRVGTARQIQAGRS